MFTIIQSPADSALALQLRQWCIDEWGKIAPFTGSVAGLLMPAPLLAKKDDELVGGLAFTGAALAGSDIQLLWVNAVFVQPAWRGQGIASQLIRHAETVAAGAGFNAVYALTDIPEMYRKLGWTVVRSSDNGYVLTRTLPGPPSDSAAPPA